MCSSLRPEILSISLPKMVKSINARRIRSEMTTDAPASEDEVIASFLRAEIESPRWQPTLVSFLDRDRMTRSILEKPNLENVRENNYRRKLLGEFRGWGTDRLLFRGFPSDVRWYRVSITPKELTEIQYIDWPYWVKISGGSRLAKDAAARIRAGLAEEHRASYEAIAHRVRAGETLPELIVVTGDAARDRIVVVEGHARLTGYLLAIDAVPDSIQVFLGRSAAVGAWGLY